MTLFDHTLPLEVVRRGSHTKWPVVEGIFSLLLPGRGVISDQPYCTYEFGLQPGLPLCLSEVLAALGHPCRLARVTGADGFCLSMWVGNHTYFIFTRLMRITGAFKENPVRRTQNTVSGPAGISMLSLRFPHCSHTESLAPLTPTVFLYLCLHSGCPTGTLLHTL